MIEVLLVSKKGLKPRTSVRKIHSVRID